MNRRNEEADPDRMPVLWREVLIFETTYRLSSGRTKSQQIEERFGFSAFTYRRLLKLALAHPEASSVAPPAVKNKWTPNSKP